MLGFFAACAASESITNENNSTRFTPAFSRPPTAQTSKTAQGRNPRQHYHYLCPMLMTLLVASLAPSCLGHRALKYLVALALVTHHPRDARHYKELIPDHLGIVHSTIETNVCSGSTNPKKY